LELSGFGSTSVVRFWLRRPEESGTTAGTV
jgi:hypothetical protein